MRCLRGGDAGQQLGERRRRGRQVGEQRTGRGVLGVTQVAQRGPVCARYLAGGTRRGAGRGERLPAHRDDEPGAQPREVLVMVGQQRAQGRRERGVRGEHVAVPGDELGLHGDGVGGHGHVGSRFRRGAQRRDALAARRDQGQRRRGRGEHATARRVPCHRVPPATACRVPRQEPTACRCRPPLYGRRCPAGAGRPVSGADQVKLPSRSG